MFVIKPYGEQALIVQFKDEISLAVHQQVKSMYLYFDKHQLKGIRSLIPAYNSLTFVFNPKKIAYETLKVFIEHTNIPKVLNQPSKIIEIPVCYDVPFALDMEEVMDYTKLTKQQIIKTHSQPLYTVYMLGFSPGFMYLGGLHPTLHIPRKATPRLKINAGAVGLADQQTGVYPQATPGGWQIIGQTPKQVFSQEDLTVANMGDQIKFVPIDAKTYQQYL